MHYVIRFRNVKWRKTILNPQSVPNSKNNDLIRHKRGGGFRPYSVFLSFASDSSQSPELPDIINTFTYRKSLQNSALNGTNSVSLVIGVTSYSETSEQTFHSTWCSEAGLTPAAETSKLWNSQLNPYNSVLLTLTVVCLFAKIPAN